MTKQPKRIIGSAFLIMLFMTVNGCRPSRVPAASSRATESRPVDLVEAVKPKGGFVGSSECRSCHSEIHDRWRMSPHAAGLTADNRKLPPHQGSCDRCHQTADIENFVGCEACHGPREDHVVSPVAVQAACRLCDIRKQCIQCHNRYIDPEFDAGSDWRRIDHGPNRR